MSTLERLGRLPSGLRVLIALIAGSFLGLAFEPYGWWPLLFLTVPALTVLVHAAGRARQTFLAGVGFGIGFMAVSINWMRVIYLQAMVGLSLLEALFFGVLGLLLWVGRGRRCWPLLAAGSWAVIEFAYSTVPFDGFPWMRLAHATIDTPLAGLLPVLGAPGVSFLAALACQLLAWVVLTDATPRRRITAAAAAVTILLAGLTGAWYGPGAVHGTVNVGYVQGSAPGGGVYGLGAPRQTTYNHLRGTQDLYGKVVAGQVPRPDFVVWPENSTDMDPFLDAETGRVIQRALAVTGVPILVGAVTLGPGPEQRQTAALWWHPRQGVQARYDKRNLVPFGEWIPFRDQILPLIPELKYVGYQSVPGTGPGVLKAALDDGRTVAVGDLICYEVAYPATAYDTVLGGAEVHVVQSSNAMYQHTGQIEQQFAITRVRAAELRREILVVTTSGISGLIRPDGSVEFQVGESQAASGVVVLPLRDQVSLAARVGPLIEAGIVVLTLLLLGWPHVLRAWRRRAEWTRSDPPPN